MIDALELGATLYMPATRDGLHRSVYGGRIAGLRSVVLCLEDAVRDDEVPKALGNLARFLAAGVAGPRPLVFVRPRSVAMLAHILCMPGVRHVAGFVLPKTTAESLPAWLALPLAPSHRLMPTLETRDAFDPVEMRRLREQLLAVQDRILAVRIGGNDLLQSLGLRRPTHRTSYDGPLGPLIASLAGLFLPYGFALSAPVMERFDDPILLRDEIGRDVEHGLLTKTAIHPAQIPVIQAGLAVPATDLAEARAVLADDAPAVFVHGGRMCEPATHARWAAALVRRADLFGVADPMPRARHG